MAQNMGIGFVSGEQGRKSVFKRKFRWTMSVGRYGGGGTEAVSQYLWYAKVANRPTLTVEETQIDHLHERHYISGKPTWETISVTLYDVKSDPNTNSASNSELMLHRWLNSVWKFSNAVDLSPTTGAYSAFDMGDHNDEYKIDITLRMLDGHGGTMESWILSGAWPSSTNWGDLDYSISDTADVEATIRFDRATFYPGEISARLVTR